MPPRCGSREAGAFFSGDDSPARLTVMASTERAVRCRVRWTTRGDSHQPQRSEASLRPQRCCGPGQWVRDGLVVGPQTLALPADTRRRHCHGPAVSLALLLQERLRYPRQGMRALPTRPMRELRPPVHLWGSGGVDMGHAWWSDGARLWHTRDARVGGSVPRVTTRPPPPAQSTSAGAPRSSHQLSPPATLWRLVLHRARRHGAARGSGMHKPRRPLAGHHRSGVLPDFLPGHGKGAPLDST